MGHAVGLDIQDPELTEVTTASMLFWKIWTALTLRGWIMSNLCPSSCHRARPLVWSRGMTGAPRSRHHDIPSEGPEQCGEKCQYGQSRHPVSVGIPAV